MTSHAPLPLPQLFDAKKAADYAYRPDTSVVASEATAWRAHHALKPSASDETRIQLLLIDVQKDFCFPEGSLYVAGRSGTGAIDDSRRIAEMIYRNLGVITDITTTMDTHLAYQIFFPSFWLDKADAPLTPHRVVTSEQIAAGEVRPNPAMAKGCAAATTRGCASRRCTTPRSSRRRASTSSTCGRPTVCSAPTGTHSPASCTRPGCFTRSRAPRSRTWRSRAATR